MRKILFTLCLLLSCQSFSQVQEFTLKNGLKILVKEDHRAPVVVSMIWYNVGSIDEQGGSTGLSHAMEHMMFKGTTTVPAGQFAKIIASLGGQDNAFTNNDYTAFFEKIDKDQLGKCFELEADRMSHLLLDAQEFSKEIKVIQEERRLRTDDNPQALTFERFLAAAHLASAYHQPVIGWMSDLKQMQVEDLRQWYAKYYTPNNATLVVVGDVSSQDVLKLAEKTFGPISSRAIPKRSPQTEPPSLGKKTVEVHAPAQLPMTLVGYTVPSVATAKNSYEPYALELIAALLDAGDGSRFSKNLIRNQQIATGADVYYNIYARYTTQFIVFGSPAMGRTLADLEHQLLKQLDELKLQPVSEEELNKVKKQIIAQKTYEKDSIFGQAMELGLLETTGVGYQKAEVYVPAITAITPAQIQQVAQRYFQEKNETVAHLNPISIKENTP